MPPRKVKPQQYKLYIVQVHDPDQDVTTTYPAIRAVSVAHADRQARDGFCGLLGVDEEKRARLNVKVSEVP